MAARSETAAAPVHRRAGRRRGQGDRRPL